MKCPNCDFEYTDGNVCPNCKIDSVLYIKTVKISDMLYNNGLTKAKVRDISGAIECLAKSIEFNKNNVTARNLLGLCYYEIGLVGDALKQWIVSVSLLKEKNPAKTYFDELQKNSRALEKFNDAIKMYNQALTYIKQKSDDMALIQLKKAIEINPRFVNALNLLTFCYLIQNEPEKAAGCAEKVLAIDANNSIALNYYNEIYPSKTRPEPGQRVKKTPQPVTNVQPPSYTRLSPKDEKRWGSSFHATEILSFIIGGICGFAVVYALLMPSAIAEKDKIISDLNAAAVTAEQATQEQISSKDNTINELQNENELLKQNSQSLTDQVSQLEKIQKAENAIKLYTEGNVEEAADAFYTMDLSGLPRDQLENTQIVKAAALDKASTDLYNEGVRNYNRGDNESANSNLEKALKYSEAETGKMDNILYYLGLIAEESEDFVSAKRYYERIIDEFPDSRQLTKATNRLNNIS